MMDSLEKEEMLDMRVQTAELVGMVLMVPKDKLATEVLKGKLQ